MVSYPIQALAKSSKTIPAMLGSFFSGKKFSTLQWMCAMGITGGTAGFTLLGKSKKGSETAVLGVVLLVGSLCFDGSVAALQTKLRESKGKEKEPTAYESMA